MPKQDQDLILNLPDQKAVQELARRANLETRICPPRRITPLNLRELWEYRELLFFLIWRDIKVRYKQTVFGAAWAVIQPFFTMVVFSIFFGRLAGVSSGEVPYPVFAFTALVPWMYFANSITQASNSLVNHEKMITKIYFPRLMIPTSSVLAGLLDFSIAFLVLVGMIFFYGIRPTPAVWMLPLLILLVVVTAQAVGLWMSALNVQYRDVRYAVPFLVQVWLFVTPIAYPVDIVPEQWRVLYGLNPMVGVVQGFRWALLGEGQPPGALLLVSTLTILVLLIAGLYYFRHMEETFADVV
jgi:lipopolysaccharide transport system permease protein